MHLDEHFQHSHYRIHTSLAILKQLAMGFHWLYQADDNNEVVSYGAQVAGSPTCNSQLIRKLILAFC